MLREEEVHVLSDWWKIYQNHCEEWGVEPEEYDVNLATKLFGPGATEDHAE